MTVQPIPIDPHYSTRFYAELWGLSESTVLRWFRDEPGVLRIIDEPKKGKRSRVGLRIPFSLAMNVYTKHTLAE